MNNYNMHFEIAALFFLVFVIVMIKIKRQLNIFKNRLFFAELHVILFLNLIDIFSSLLLNGRESLKQYEHWMWVAYGVTMFTYLLQQVAIMLFLLYITTFMELKKVGTFMFRLFGVLSIAYAFLVVSTPFTKLVFYLEEDGTYQHGKLHEVYFLVPLACGIYTVILMIAKWRSFSLIEKRIFAFFCLSTFLVFGIQVFLLPTHLVIYFWIAIALVAVFLSLQSPDYYLDRTTSAFNSDGLMVMLNDRIARKKPFSVFLMSVYDFEGIEGGFSTQNKRLVYRQLCSVLIHGQNGRKLSEKKRQGNGQSLYLHGRKRDKLDVFRDDDKIYIMLYDVPDAEKNAISIGTWVTEGIQLDGKSKPVKLVAKMLLFDFPGDIRSEEEFHSLIKYFLTDDYYNRFNVLNSMNEEFFRKKKRYEDVRGLVEEAIRTEGIEMYYQPIYSAERDDFHSAEALVRLRDVDSIGFVSPEEFIRIAEKEHLILQLEDIILRKICKFIQNAELKKYGIEYIEVNLSGNQCMQEDLYTQLQDLIEEFHISPDFINFEVTETAAIGDSSCLSYNMEKMKSFGSTFTLDDYGSGASNLQYLVDYPFEIVKLDKSIVWTHFREADPKTRPVLPLSVRMLREMNVLIVAEGVEYEEEKEGLIRMGVQYLQGYYFSKPIGEKEFLQFLREHNGGKRNNG